MLILSLLSLTLGAPAPTPRALVEGAIAALQRSTSLATFHSLKLIGVQHEWMLGNAERAEGPWRVTYSQFTELHDLDGPSLRRTERAVLPSGGTSAERISILADSVTATMTNGRQAGASHSLYEDVIDRLDGSPVRALRLASASPALKAEQPVTRYGLAFDVVSFPWRNGRMRIEIHRDSHLPQAVEIVRPYVDNFRWAPFGDVTMRMEYVDWAVAPGGYRWPMQTKVSLNG